MSKKPKPTCGTQRRDSGRKKPIVQQTAAHCAYSSFKNNSFRERLRGGRREKESSLPSPPPLLHSPRSFGGESRGEGDGNGGEERVAVGTRAEHEMSPVVSLTLFHVAREFLTVEANLFKFENTITTTNLAQNNQSENENVLELILRLSQSKLAIANKLSLSTQHQVQIFSTNYTVKGISSFLGKNIENVCDWIKEPIADYIIYDKDAVINKASSTLKQSDRVSLIIQGITKHEWAIPLKTAMWFLSRTSQTGLYISKLQITKKKHGNYNPRFHPSVYKEEDQENGYKIGAKGINNANNKMIYNKLKSNTIDSKDNKFGWIGLRIQVRNIDYVMPKAGLWDKLLIVMILDPIEPNRDVWIITPSSIQEFRCVKSKTAFVECVVQSRFNITLLVTKTFDMETTQSLPNSYKDIFPTPEAELENFLILKWRDPFTIDQIYLMINKIVGQIKNTNRYHHFAPIARLLTNLLKNKPISRNKSSNYKIKSSDDEYHVLVKLKLAITSSPVLEAFRQNVTTKVETEASHEGLAFDFELIYRAGKLNIIADHILRYPQRINYKNLCLATINSQNDESVQAQQTDSFYNNIIVHANIKTGCEVPKIVITYLYCNTILQQYHDNTGHFEIKKTLSTIEPVIGEVQHPDDWDVKIPNKDLAINTTQQSTTKFSLMDMALGQFNQII
ncbi:hypothetical protein QTP88_026621 [Uroleucon formosanum]